jgi:prepilin-type processing-associated H-X9-DG protein
MVGDKRLNRRALNGFQGDDNEGYTSGWDHDTVRFSWAGAPMPDPVTGDGQSRFGSAHPGRTNMCFADGSVRTLRYGMPDANFRAMCGIADGLVPQFD